jgi:hypothetical protein
MIGPSIVNPIAWPATSSANPIDCRLTLNSVDEWDGKGAIVAV